MNEVSEEGNDWEDEECEVAYRIPGKTGFLRRKFPSEKAMAKWIENITAREGDDIEFRFLETETNSVKEGIISTIKKAYQIEKANGIKPDASILNNVMTEDNKPANERCNCECSACEEAGVHIPGDCKNELGPDAKQVEMLGPVCGKCAEHYKDYIKESTVHITESYNWEDLGMSPEDIENESDYDPETMCPNCKGWGFIKHPSDPDRAINCKACRGTGQKDFRGEISGEEAKMYDYMEDIDESVEPSNLDEISLPDHTCTCGSTEFDDDTLKCKRCGKDLSIPEPEFAELTDKEKEELEELEFKKKLKKESVGVTTSDAGVYQTRMGEVYPKWDYPEKARDISKTSPEGTANVGKKFSHSSRMYPRMKAMRESADRRLKLELKARRILKNER